MHPYFLFVLLVSNLPWSPATADSYNIYEIEIAGVRLGMSPDAALKDVAKYYSISVDEFVTETHDGTEPFPGAEKLKDQPSVLEYQPNIGTPIRIEFAPSTVRKDSGYMIVYSVELGYPGVKSSEIRERQKLAFEEAVQKIGPPTTQSIKSENQWSYSWCAEDTDQKSCARGSASFEINESQSFLIDPKIPEMWMKEMRDQ